VKKPANRCKRDSLRLPLLQHVERHPVLAQCKGAQRGHDGQRRSSEKQAQTERDMTREPNIPPSPQAGPR
jgi:hypothetical protein